MTPIQTKFAGNLYRSRLEARYAVLFQACRLPFEYEREGFLLEQGRYLPYLPDFWLPTLGTWLEVKGMLPGARDNAISQLLADQTQRRVIIACGPPEMAANLSCFFPDWHGTLFQTLSAFLMQWLPPEIVIRAIGTAQSARFEFRRNPKDRSAAIRTTAIYRSAAFLARATLPAATETQPAVAALLFRVVLQGLGAVEGNLLIAAFKFVLRHVISRHRHPPTRPPL